MRQFFIVLGLFIASVSFAGEESTPVQNESANTVCSEEIRIAGIRTLAKGVLAELGAARLSTLVAHELESHEGLGRRFGNWERVHGNLSANPESYQVAFSSLAARVLTHSEANLRNPAAEHTAPQLNALDVIDPIVVKVLQEQVMEGYLALSDKELGAPYTYWSQKLKTEPSQVDFVGIPLLLAEGTLGIDTPSDLSLAFSEERLLDEENLPAFLDQVSRRAALFQVMSLLRHFSAKDLGLLSRELSSRGSAFERALFAVRARQSELALLRENERQQSIEQRAAVVATALDSSRLAREAAQRALQERIVGELNETPSAREKQAETLLASMKDLRGQRESLLANLLKAEAALKSRRELDATDASAATATPAAVSSLTKDQVRLFVDHDNALKEEADEMSESESDPEQEDDSDVSTQLLSAVGREMLTAKLKTSFRKGKVESLKSLIDFPGTELFLADADMDWVASEFYRVAKEAIVEMDTTDPGDTDDIANSLDAMVRAFAAHPHGVDPKVIGDGVKSLLTLVIQCEDSEKFGTYDIYFKIVSPLHLAALHNRAVLTPGLSVWGADGELSESDESKAKEFATASALLYSRQIEFEVRARSDDYKGIDWGYDLEEAVKPYSDYLRNEAESEIPEPPVSLIASVLLTLADGKHSDGTEMDYGIDSMIRDGDFAAFDETVRSLIQDGLLRRENLDPDVLAPVNARYRQLIEEVEGMDNVDRGDLENLDDMMNDPAWAQRPQVAAETPEDEAQEDSSAEGLQRRIEASFGDSQAYAIGQARWQTIEPWRARFHKLYDLIREAEEDLSDDQVNLLVSELRAAADVLTPNEFWVFSNNSIFGAFESDADDDSLHVAKWQSVLDAWQVEVLQSFHWSDKDRAELMVLGAKMVLTEKMFDRDTTAIPTETMKSIGQVMSRYLDLRGWEGSGRLRLSPEQVISVQRQLMLMADEVQKEFTESYDADSDQAPEFKQIEEALRGAARSPTVNELLLEPLQSLEAPVSSLQTQIRGMEEDMARIERDLQNISSTNPNSGTP